MNGHGGRVAISVVIASIDARATVARSLEGFLDEVRDRGEVVLVDSSGDGTADVAAREFRSVRVLRQPCGLLAPELWRDGLRATSTPLVAFTTAQMVPASGWLDAMLDRMESTGAAAVGGPIEPARALSAHDRAMYLLRYVSYLPPLPDEGRGVEPPGDNAVYRRSALEGLEPLWEQGFWEVPIHRRLRERGHRLAMASGAVAEYRGGSRLGPALRQRQAHARHYGASRAERMGQAQRLARSAAAPVVPAVLLRRIGSTLAARGRPIGPWLPALPSLSLLLLAWSMGEASGTWFGSKQRVA